MPVPFRFLSAALVACMALAGCANQMASKAMLPTDPASLQSLAEHGNPVAANNLGVLYANGVKVPQDFALAKKWYEFASEHNDPAGAFNLGIAYQRGQGTPVDLPEAVKWFRLAVDKNYAPAKLSLAIMYHSGQGVEHNEAEYIRLIRDAAIQGFPAAQALVSTLYLENPEVPADDSLAYEWASVASSKLTGPLGVISNRIRDNAAKGLSAAELAMAQATAASWKQGTDMTSVFPPGSPPRPPRLRGTGSGFVVGKGGEIATDFHVVPNCREIKLINPDTQTPVESRIIGEDRASDLAILSGGSFGTHLKIRNAPGELGEAVTTYGFPLGSVLGGGNLTSGSISGMTGFQGNAKTFQMTVPVQAGSSGGPVVDESGAVVGIVTSKLNALTVAAATGDLAQNVNFASRASLLRALLDDKRVGYDATGKSPAHSAADIATLLQKATVKIECWR